MSRSDWFDQRRDTLEDLFDALGLSSEWTEDLDDLVTWMERNWLQGEHGTQHGKPTFDSIDEEAVRSLLDSLGLGHRVEPPRGSYDEVVVLGAAGIGLHRRLDLVHQSGVHADGLSVLAGLRPHERAARDGGLSELLDDLGRFAAAPGWTAPSGLRWRKGLLTGTGIDEYTAAAVLLSSETDLAELLLRKQWPDAIPVETVHGPPHPIVNELGQRGWVMRTFEVTGSIPVLRVLNGAPVDRSPRPPRPTSRSTFIEWLDLVAPDQERREVLVVVNQPHLGRVRLELLMLLNEIGRNDIVLEFAGCEVVNSGSVVLQLGEIPAWIRADLRATAS